MRQATPAKPKPAQKAAPTKAAPPKEPPDKPMAAKPAPPATTRGEAAPAPSATQPLKAPPAVSDRPPAKAAVTPAPQARPQAPAPARPAPPPPPKPVEPQETPQLPVTSGKVSIFGGPRDRGLKPDDKLALPTGLHFIYERVRTLNPDSFYCSMRWEYHVRHMTPEEVKRFWANKKLVITNPKSNVSVIARAVDWGPHQNTGLDIGLSPGAARALGVEAGDEVQIVLGDPKSPLGVVS